MSEAKEEKNSRLKVSKTQLTLGQVGQLLKQDLITELRKRGVECGDSDRRDDLRKLLANIVRTESEGVEAAKTILENLLESVGRKPEEDGNTGTDSTDSDDRDMASNSKIEFKLNTDDWETFTERLELQFKLKKTEDEMKTAMLLTSVDEEAYILFRNLCAPAKPVTKDYAALVELMSNHISPKPSKVMERCTFNRARQGENESIAEFAAKLRKLSLHCEFQNLDDALRDQFVCGVHDENTRIEMFKIPDLTFDNALKGALARESAVKNAIGAERTLMTSRVKEEVFSMERNFRSNASEKRNVQNSQRNWNTQFKRYPNERKCFCCGGTGHVAAICRHRGATCHGCGRRGHLQKACLSRNKETSNKFMEERAEPDSGSGDPDSSSGDPTMNNYVEFYAINAKVDKCCYNLIKADPNFLDVVINGKVISMEVDTGTYFTVISEKCTGK